MPRRRPATDRFLGPHGSLLFTSIEAGSFEEAAAVARRRWNTMDGTRRDLWHGREGLYAKVAPCNACTPTTGACDTHKPKRAA
jgi:hypothetical protein